MLAMPEDHISQQQTPQSIDELKAAGVTKDVKPEESVPTEAKSELEPINSEERVDVQPSDDKNVDESTDQPSLQPTSDEIKIVSQESEHKSDIDNFFKTDDPQLIKEQLKYCSTLLKGLRRHREGTPFLAPVDPIALGIPDYLKVITKPMDLSTISKKLEGGEYACSSEFVADVRLMLNNCFTFNAPDSQVAKMGRNLEKYFNNALAKMPVSMEQAVALAATSSPGRAARRKSDSSASPMAARPRREASAPTSRRGSSGNNVIYSAPPSASGKGKRQSGDMTFCRQVITELTKKTHQNLNWPFMQPVDPVALGIPDYFTVVKQPMDLSTIRHKIDAREYLNAEQFEADVRLVFTNCYTYNAPDTDVVQMAKALESIFESKWAQRPLRTPTTTDHTRASMDDEERILAISQQISTLQSELNMLLMRRRSAKPRSSHHHQQQQQQHHHQSSSVAQPAAPTVHKQKKSAAQLEEELNIPMTFEEKRQLSDDVNQLTPDKLFKVVEIIHDSIPNLNENGDSDVIELDVETLDVRTLRKLQRYVRECCKKRKPTSKSAGSGKKANTNATNVVSSTSASADVVPFPVESSDESSDESGDE